MNINVKLTPERLSRCDPGVAEAFQDIECGGVSVDNDGDLVIIDDKEGVVAVLESADWKSFEFTKEAEPAPCPTYRKVETCGHGFPPEACPETATTYGTGLAR